MEKQQTFASVAWNRRGKDTRRERLLVEMDAVVPWRRLSKLVSPRYHQGKTGRVPHDLERMLRNYFMQQWFNLPDSQAEDAIYDSESMRRFARVELEDDKVRDGLTILRFRHLLKTQDLTESIFEAVKDLLAEHRLTLRAGRVVTGVDLAAGLAWPFREFAPFVHRPARSDESARFHRASEPAGSIGKSLRERE